MAELPPDSSFESPESAFAARLHAVLADAARGQAEAFQAALENDPALASAVGPHPFWGGGASALQVAAEWGRIENVRALLDAGADPNADASAYDNWSPLHCALGKQYDEIAALLIERGASIDVWSAAMLGDGAKLEELLTDDPALVKARGPALGTPLHFAATTPVARLLLDRDADPRTLNRYGATPARAAAYAGQRRREVAELLVEVTGEADPFIEAALGRVAALAQRLDAQPELLEERDEHLGPASARGGTLLHFAAAIGDAELAKLVLDRGAPPDVRSAEGHTPLHYAARNGHTEIACLLLERGASVDTLDAQHQATPLDWADFFRRDSVRDLLLQHGAGPD